MTEEFSMATGGNTDPFYQSTGKRKDVTIDGVTYKNTLDVGSTKPPAAKGIGSISPATGLEITGNERNLAKEKEAMGVGYTKEYIASRGGINSEGYFNDTPLTGQITPEERKSVTKTDGTIDSTAMLDILNKKSGGTGVGTGDGTGDDSGGVKKNIGGLKTDAEIAAEILSTEKREERQSAYDLLFEQFNQYGLGSLVTPLKDLIMSGVSPSEFTIRLRETDAYKKRFAANAQRLAKGLRALSEAEYIGTEDQYQDVMRRYGMPESYYAKGDLGVQSGFEKFLAGDVSAVELEDRIQTANNRVVNSNPEVAKALKEFYPGISNGDILAYVLDPANAIEQIKRKVTAAEIGGAAIQSGLKTGMTRAEELAAAGITKQQAQQGFQTVAEVAPRGGVLAEIYKQDPYTQTTAEQEVFGLAGSVDASRQRRKLTQLETAAFSGSAGMGAIARDRAGAF